MSKSEFYRQCVLRRDAVPQGEIKLVTWIEERFALQGKKVCIKDDPAHPETDVWVVAEVGIRKSAEWVNDRQKAHERWRQVTDV